MKHQRAAILVAILGLISMALHFYFGWIAAVESASAHGEPFTVSGYGIEWARDTFENLQSELFQLALQFLLLSGALAFLGIKVHEDVEDE